MQAQRVPCRTRRKLEVSIRANLNGLADIPCCCTHTWSSAYKFAVSAAEATSYVAPMASIGSMFSVQNIFSAMAARYLPWSGIQPRRPHKIGAFYVPIWAVDAAVEAKVWLTRRGEEESKQVRHTILRTVLRAYDCSKSLVTAIFQNSYVSPASFRESDSHLFADACQVRHQLHERTSKLNPALRPGL